MKEGCSSSVFLLWISYEDPNISRESDTGAEQKWGGGETLSLAWNLIQKRQGEGDDAGAFSGLCLLT